MEVTLQLCTSLVIHWIYCLFFVYNVHLKLGISKMWTFIMSLYVFFMCWMYGLYAARNVPSIHTHKQAVLSHTCIAKHCGCYCSNFIHFIKCVAQIDLLQHVPHTCLVVWSICSCPTILTGRKMAGVTFLRRKVLFNPSAPLTHQSSSSLWHSSLQCWLAVVMCITINVWCNENRPNGNISVTNNNMLIFFSRKIQPGLSCNSPDIVQKWSASHSWSSWSMTCQSQEEEQYSPRFHLMFLHFTKLLNEK